jgi:glycosyltransferase involved in cell wall biosynthesis
MIQCAFEERYYARKSARSLVVSPVDKQALDRLSGRPDRSVILLNGVRIPPATENPKVPLQLIFTGNMSFPPNYEAALWFLDFVFPLVQAEIPEVKLVLAGATPPQQLLQRANSNIQVTGFVDDLNAEIARSSLFVAPLISGGGFKNKVVEALANRTYVVASPLAVEFLEPSIRELVTVETDPARMAIAIIQFLRNPAAFADRLDQLHNFVKDQLSWSGKTSELLRLIESV